MTGMMMSVDSTESLLCSDIFPTVTAVVSYVKYACGSLTYLILNAWLN